MDTPGIDQQLQALTLGLSNSPLILPLPGFDQPVLLNIKRTNPIPPIKEHRGIFFFVRL